MNKLTPPKHRTPNYRLVTETFTEPTSLRILPLGYEPRIHTVSTWQPVPLRQDRKDLQTDAERLHN